jgi:hypothetical protein
MQEIKDIFRNTIIPILLCIAFGIFKYPPVLDPVSSFFISSESISDERALAHSISMCRTAVNAEARKIWIEGTRPYDPSWNLEQCEKVKSVARAVAEGRDSLDTFQRVESKKQIKRDLRDTFDLIQLTSLFLLLVIILRNTYIYILKGQLGVDLFAAPRRLVISRRSKSAEKELLRYKNLFDNGLLSTEEFAEKKKELMPSILNYR